MKRAETVRDPHGVRTLRPPCPHGHRAAPATWASHIHACPTCETVMAATNAWQHRRFLDGVASDAAHLGVAVPDAATLGELRADFYRTSTARAILDVTLSDTTPSTAELLHIVLGGLAAAEADSLGWSDPANPRALPTPAALHVLDTHLPALLAAPDLHPEDRAAVNHALARVLAAWATADAAATAEARRRALAPRPGERAALLDALARQAAAEHARDLVARLTAADPPHVPPRAAQTRILTAAPAAPPTPGPAVETLAPAR